MTISLSELLQSRDNRQMKQRELINIYQKPVLSLTLVMPGPVKRNEQTALLALIGVSAVEQAFGDSIVYAAEYDLPTGFEALFVVSEEKENAKRIACNVEDDHPMGRLFDIDIIGEDGLPVSRETVGRLLRKCLVCDNEAHACTRNQTHSLEEVLDKIEEIINPPNTHVQPV
jgi:holo-ACP synthase CitX